MIRALLVRWRHRRALWLLRQVRAVIARGLVYEATPPGRADRRALIRQWANHGYRWRRGRAAFERHHARRRP